MSRIPFVLNSSNFLTIFFTSQGARNCPFLMLRGRLVFAAAWRRSVCRHRNAGICMRSTTCDTIVACSG